MKYEACGERPSTSLTNRAARISLYAHFAQRDRAGVPYANHAAHLAKQFEDEVLIAAAFLHDVVEDTALTLEDLAAEGIPAEVLQLVDALTRRDGEQYFDYIRRVKQNPDATKIKLADLIHNADLGRLDCVTDADRSLQKRYLKAIRILTEAGDGT